jgi:hypothetical protein
MFMGSQKTPQNYNITVNYNDYRQKSAQKLSDNFKSLDVDQMRERFNIDQ